MNRSVPLALVPLLVFLALLVGHWVPGHPNEASDSRVLVAGAQVALDCLREGVFFECGTSAEDLARAQEPYPVLRSSVTAGLVVGTVAASVTNAALNLFRYGTVLNEEYRPGGNFTELYGIRDIPLEQRAEFFGGLLVAPNAGVLVFWPVAAV